MPDQNFRLNITGPEGSRQQELSAGLLTIGRQVGNDLLLDNAQVSRSHARIACTQASCQITDLDSSNGTYLNGEKLAPQVPVDLNPGDILRIGPFELAFEAYEAPRPEPVEAAEPEPQPEEPSGQPEAQEQPEAQAQPEAKKQPEPQPAAGKQPAREKSRAQKAPPPGRTPPPPPPAAAAPRPDPSELVPPGLSLRSQRLIHYLPGIYQTDFMERFLGIFEAILTPIEWTVDNFDLFLSPASAPAEFLGWLGNWYQASFDSTWSESQRRQLLADAHRIYARRGTRWALSRVLEIYTGAVPEINDLDENLEPFTFKVHIPIRQSETHPKLVEALIDAHKPAHTTYQVSYG